MDSRGRVPSYTLSCCINFPCIFETARFKIAVKVFPSVFRFFFWQSCCFAKKKSDVRASMHRAFTKNIYCFCFYLVYFLGELTPHFPNLFHIPLKNHGILQRQNCQRTPNTTNLHALISWFYKYWLYCICYYYLSLFWYNFLQMVSKWFDVFSKHIMRPPQMIYGTSLRNLWWKKQILTSCVGIPKLKIPITN